jgi:hypothetical protein
MTLYVAILFFLLTPGVLLTLPNADSIYVSAGVHAVVFALVYYLTHKMVWRTFYKPRQESSNQESS